MKIIVDNLDDGCSGCLFSKKTGEKHNDGYEVNFCNLLNKENSEFMHTIDGCPLVSLNDIKIKTEIISGFYSDDMLKISLILNNEELSSSKIVYKSYIGSEDD